VTHFKKLQVIKCHLLKHSPDEDIRRAYAARTTVKRPSHWLAQIEPSVDHRLKYKGQTDRAGLGSVKGRYSANVSAKEHRARCAKAVAEQDQGAAYQHTVSLAWQSVWSTT
jgi:hypothetical protein